MSGKRTRNEPVMFYVDADMKAAINAEAERHGLQRAPWLRMIITAEIRRTKQERDKERGE